MQAIYPTLSLLEPIKHALSQASHTIHEIPSILEIQSLAAAPGLQRFRVYQTAIIPPFLYLIRNLFIVKIAQHLWKSARANSISLTGRIAIITSTVATTIAVEFLLHKECQKRWSVIKTAARFANQHSTQLLMLALTCSCVALIALGSPYLGMAGLASLAIIHLSKQEWVGSKTRRVLRTLNDWTWTLGCLAAGDVILKVVAILFIIDEIAKCYSAWKESRQLAVLASRTKPQLSTEQYSQLVEQSTTKIDPQHVFEYKLLGDEPTLNIRHSLTSLQEATDWTNTKLLETIDTHLQKNTLWLNLQENNLEDSVEINSIAYIQHGLELLAHKIADQQIIEDEPADYTPLRIHLKQNIAMLQKLSVNSDERNTALVQLALAGYDNGRDIAETISQQHLYLQKATVQELDLSLQIQVQLTLFRESITKESAKQVVEDLCAIPDTPNPDPHLPMSEQIKTEFKRSIGSKLRQDTEQSALVQHILYEQSADFGVPQSTSILSPTAYLRKSSETSNSFKDALQHMKKCINANLQAGYVIDEFHTLCQEKYSSKSIIDKIKTLITEKQLPETLLQDWFTNWQIRNYLTLTTINSVEDYDDAMITLMLIEMGILIPENISPK
jgi:hypothetical protein